jgi:hypothetical protein
MYLTIQNIHKIIQSQGTRPLWINNIVIERDKYKIQIYINTSASTLHTIELMRKQNQLLQTYGLIINGKYNEDIPHWVLRDKKDFIQWIHNQLSFYYPIYF